jgi:predicted GNAT superfamily acetyltransferase
MKIGYRELKRDEELKACVALQEEIWGLDPYNVTSMITLTAMTMDHPRLGLLMGAFDDERLVGFSFFLASLEPHNVYGHMLGVLKEYRDRKVGVEILNVSFERLAEVGAKRIVWTYEPLESRNAHVYFNHIGGRVLRYHTAHFGVGGTMHQGMPLDRFIFETRLGVTPSLPEFSVGDALKRYPVADGRMWPDDDGLLVQIPGDLQELKSQDMDAAGQWRMRTRGIFEDYINRRRYAVEGFLSGHEKGERRSYYLLRAREKK